MSKFVKRLRKIKKNLDNCVVVGSGLGRFNEFSNEFKSVFVLKTSDDVIKGKNIIYRENFRDISIISDIDFAFIDLIYLDRIGEIENLLNKCRPVIMIDSGEFIDKKFAKNLRILGFEIVELFKDYQVWTSKK